MSMFNHEAAKNLRLQKIFSIEYNKPAASDGARNIRYE